MRTIQLEGLKMTDEERAHRHIRNRMDFDDQYGNNLDSLWEYLSDIDKPTCVILNNGEAIKENLGDFAYEMIDTFEDATRINNDLLFEYYD